MKSLIRLIIGALSILPLIFWVNRFGFLFGLNLSLSPSFANSLVAISIGLFLFFIYKLIQIETIGNKSKALWVARFILTGFIAMPIFWYFFILKEEEYARFGEEDYEDESVSEIGGREKEG